MRFWELPTESREQFAHLPEWMRGELITWTENGPQCMRPADHPANCLNLRPGAVDKCPVCLAVTAAEPPMPTLRRSAQRPVSVRPWLRRAHAADPQ